MTPSSALAMATRIREIIAFLREAPVRTEAAAKADLAATLERYPSFADHETHYPHMVGGLLGTIDIAVADLEQLLALYGVPAAAGRERAA